DNAEELVDDLGPRRAPERLASGVSRVLRRIVGEGLVDAVERLEDEIDPGDLRVGRAIVADAGHVAAPVLQAGSLCEVRIEERSQSAGHDRDAVDLPRRA